MRQKLDIHNMQQRYERALQRLKADKGLSDSNRKAILRFMKDLQVDNITNHRLTKYLYLLGMLAKRLQKDFDKATVDDIKNLVAEINKTNYAAWTKADCRITLKRFYRWLRGLPPGQNPPETAWIRGAQNKNQILPEELLTEEEITRLIEACENSRDRAFVLSLYETGGRIGELLNLMRRRVQFDQYGAVLLVLGKTGDRRVRVITAAPLLAQWLNDHPRKDPDAPLWVVIGSKHHGEPLLYDSARLMLHRLGKKTGIQKHVNQHMSRHSRASYLANSLTEAQLKEYLGWTKDSDMLGVYVHLSGRNIDGALLRMHGIENQESKSAPKLTPTICPRCTERNAPTSRFCGKCGLPLRVDAAEVEHARKEVDEVMDRLLEDPEIRAVLLAKLKGMLARPLELSR